MTESEAIQLLARMVTELRNEVAAERRTNAWHRQTLARRWGRIRQLERRTAQLDNRMYRFWMDTYTPQQATELAKELIA